MSALAMEQGSEKGTEQVGKKQIAIYGMGNFAAQLSWTMVSTYLILFYTDVFGLAAGTVATLMLVTKLWDGINDPIMGAVMERTHTRWGSIISYVYNINFYCSGFW